MRVKIQFECQTCLRTYDLEDNAMNCHPVKQVYTCSECLMEYDEKVSAEYCCVEDAKWKTDKKFKAEDLFE